MEIRYFKFQTIEEDGQLYHLSLASPAQTRCLLRESVEGGLWVTEKVTPGLLHACAFAEGWNNRIRFGVRPFGLQKPRTVYVYRVADPKATASFMGMAGDNASVRWFLVRKSTKPRRGPLRRVHVTLVAKITGVYPPRWLVERAMYGSLFHWNRD